MKKVYLAISATLVASPAVANGSGTFGMVPEIDAMAGFAAVAVVGAAVALIRERSK